MSTVGSFQSVDHINRTLGQAAPLRPPRRATTEMHDVRRRDRLEYQQAHEVPSFGHPQAAIAAGPVGDEPGRPLDKPRSASWLGRSAVHGWHAHVRT
jgi:hypothetical protein